MKGIEIKSELGNRHLKINEYFKEAFKTAKEVLRQEKALILMFLILGLIPNIYADEIHLGVILFPVYLLNVVHYIAFTSINNGLNIRFITSNILIIVILRLLRDWILLFLLGKYIGRISGKGHMKGRKLAIRSLILALVYLLPMFLIPLIFRMSFLLLFSMSYSFLGMVRLFFNIVLIVVNIAFLYFIPLYISEEISLKEAFSKSLKLGKGNRLRQIGVLTVFLLMFLIVELILFSIGGFIGNIIPYGTSRNNLEFLMYPLPAAVINTIIANILRIVLAVYGTSLVSVVFSDVSRNNEREV